MLIRLIPDRIAGKKPFEEEYRNLRQESGIPIDERYFPCTLHSVPRRAGSRTVIVCCLPPDGPWVIHIGLFQNRALPHEHVQKITGHLKGANSATQNTVIQCLNISSPGE